MQGTVPGTVGNSGRNEILPLSEEDRVCIQISVRQGRRDGCPQRGVIECSRDSEEGGILGRGFWLKDVCGRPCKIHLM